MIITRQRYESIRQSGVHHKTKKYVGLRAEGDLENADRELYLPTYC